MPLALLETPDGADHGPPGIEAERRLGAPRAGASDPEASDVDAVLQQRPAAAHALVLALDAQRVGVDEHRVDLTRDTPPRPSRAAIRAGQAPLAGQAAAGRRPSRPTSAPTSAGRH